jgi:hypothetical protein
VSWTNTFQDWWNHHMRLNVVDEHVVYHWNNSTVK